jgi:hypothetical protein
MGSSSPCLAIAHPVYDRVGDGPWTLVAVGRYRDRPARQADGNWLFTSRALTFL